LWLHFVVLVPADRKGGGGKGRRHQFGLTRIKMNSSKKNNEKNRLCRLKTNLSDASWGKEKKAETTM